MVIEDFKAAIAYRTVSVECPRDADGEIIPPPQPPDRSLRPWPEHLSRVQWGDNGTCLFLWTGDVSDDEALSRSVKIFEELYR